ncbi:chorismate mutase [Pontixanthobacter sp.]|uniref:chorismate mutase n=1 Tax=Pontixanthobacter sp. TaxID=2792078 RepID=UPI003C7A8E75
MTDTSKAPENCNTMAEVRAGVDATDLALIKLLEIRYGYMRAAARIKETRGAVRDEERKASVIEAAADAAQNAGLPHRDIAEIWDRLVESSIAYELIEWERIRG